MNRSIRKPTAVAQYKPKMGQSKSKENPFDDHKDNGPVLMVKQGSDDLRYIYVMYHGCSRKNTMTSQRRTKISLSGTDSSRIDSILTEGLQPQSGDSDKSNSLGVGIYASRDPKKTVNYGDVRQLH